MKVTWTRDVSDSQRVIDIENNFKVARITRQRLIEILNKKIEASAEASRSNTNYELAAWPFMQADRCGYERAMAEIASLLKD